MRISPMNTTIIRHQPAAMGSTPAAVTGAPGRTDWDDECPTIPRFIMKTVCPAAAPVPAPRAPMETRVPTPPKHLKSVVPATAKAALGSAQVLTPNQMPEVLPQHPRKLLYAVPDAKTLELRKFPDIQELELAEDPVILLHNFVTENDWPWDCTISNQACIRCHISSLKHYLGNELVIRDNSVFRGYDKPFDLTARFLNFDGHYWIRVEGGNHISFVMVRDRKQIYYLLRGRCLAGSEHCDASRFVNGFLRLDDGATIDMGHTVFTMPLYRF